MYALHLAVRMANAEDRALPCIMAEIGQAAG